MEKLRGDGEEERQRRAPYRFLCSRAPCRSEWGWSSPGWRGTSCGPTWCCCGPIIGRRAPATWCRPSPCPDPSPRWPSSRGAACPGRSCTWPRETGGHRRSRGFEGKSLCLRKEDKSKWLVTKAVSSDQSFLNVWQPYVYSSEQGKACGRINILPPCEVVNYKNGVVFVWLEWFSVCGFQHFSVYVPVSDLCLAAATGNPKS